MHRQQTKKLFYNKYPYKIELKCGGASYVSLRGIDSVIRSCENNDNLLGTRFGWRLHRDVDTVELYHFAKAIEPYVKEKVKSRSEGSHFNFFLDDKSKFDTMVDTLKKFVVSVSEPGSEEELEYLKNNKRKVVVEELPYGTFKHKIVFKTNWKADKGIAFVNWLAKYPAEDYKISESSYRYLTGSSRYFQDPFMYIRETKMLTMLQLFAGDKIKYAEEFVPRSTLLL